MSPASHQVSRSPSSDIRALLRFTDVGGRPGPGWHSTPDSLGRSARFGPRDDDRARTGHGAPAAALALGRRPRLACGVWTDPLCSLDRIGERSLDQP